jgi:hypothetical protein
VAGARGGGGGGVGAALLRRLMPPPLTSPTQAAGDHNCFYAANQSNILASAFWIWACNHETNHKLLPCWPYAYRQPIRSILAAISVVLPAGAPEVDLCTHCLKNLTPPVPLGALPVLPVWDTGLLDHLCHVANKVPTGSSERVRRWYNPWVALAKALLICSGLDFAWDMPPNSWVGCSLLSVDSIIAATCYCSRDTCLVKCSQGSAYLHSWYVLMEQMQFFVVNLS